MENRSAPLEIARESPSWNQYDGWLDELRLWNVRRTAAPDPGVDDHRTPGPSRASLATGASMTARRLRRPPTRSAPRPRRCFLERHAVGRRRADEPGHRRRRHFRHRESNFTSSSATIPSRPTNRPPARSLYWATSPAGPFTDVFSAAIGTTHMITLTGLAPDTPIRFTARAHDAATNPQSAAPRVPDARPPRRLQPPTVTFVTPAVRHGHRPWSTWKLRRPTTSRWSRPLPARWRRPRRRRTRPPRYSLLVGFFAAGRRRARAQRGSARCGEQCRHGLASSARLV